MNAVGGVAGRKADDVCRGAPSWWSRGWRLVAGAAMVTMIGITAFAAAAAGMSRPPATSSTHSNTHSTASRASTKAAVATQTAVRPGPSAVRPPGRP